MQNNPPIHISHLNPLVQIPFHHPTPKIPKFHFTTITNKPNQPSQKQPQTQMSHIFLETTTSIQYTLKLTHDLHESESHQKDILIKNLTERLDNLTNRVQHVEGNKKLGGLSYEDLCMHPDVELPEGYKLPKFEMFNGIGIPKPTYECIVTNL